MACLQPTIAYALLIYFPINPCKPTLNLNANIRISIHEHLLCTRNDIKPISPSKCVPLMCSRAFLTNLFSGPFSISPNVFQHARHYTFKYYWINKTEHTKKQCRHIAQYFHLFTILFYIVIIIVNHKRRDQKSIMKLFKPCTWNNRDILLHNCFSSSMSKSANTSPTQGSKNFEIVLVPVPSLIAGGPHVGHTNLAIWSYLMWAFQQMVASSNAIPIIFNCWYIKVFNLHYLLLCSIEYICLIFPYHSNANHKTRQLHSNFQ